MCLYAFTCDVSLLGELLACEYDVNIEINLAIFHELCDK